MCSCIATKKKNWKRDPELVKTTKITTVTTRIKTLPGIFSDETPWGFMGYEEKIEEVCEDFDIIPSKPASLFMTLNKHKKSL